MALVFFTVCLTYPLNKEVVSAATSLFVFQTQDSIQFKYKEINILYKSEDYTKSLRLALDLLRNKNLLSEDELYNIYFIIGNIFYRSNDYQNSLKYYKKVLNMYSLNYLKQKNKDFQNSFFQNGNESSLIYFESLLNIGTLTRKINFRKNKVAADSALFYFKKITENNLDTKEFKLLKAKAFNNISMVFTQDALYDKSKENINKAIEIHKELNNKIDQASALGNLSSIFLLESDYIKAKATYFEALELVEDIKTDEALKVRRDLYLNLAFNLFKLKDYKAYIYQEKSYSIKDSIQEKQFRQIIAEIERRNDFEIKRDLFLKEEENKRLKGERKFWVAGSVLIFLIFSLGYLLNYYKLKQKNLGLKLSQTELLQNQKLEKLRSESQTRILNATIDGKETERKQIAETLHDSVSALLSSANLHLQATKTAFNGKTPIEIDKTRDIITEASHKIRDLSHSLVSSILLKFGLKFAIKDMAKKYSNSQIEIITDIGSVRRYEQDFEIKVHNITQEFLNNILKHSKATEAKIELEEKDKKLYLKVTDNGKGFDKTKVINKDGLGINQIEARIIVMKGKFVIDSEIGKGTSISVEIPVKEKEVMHHA